LFCIFAISEAFDAYANANVYYGIIQSLYYRIVRIVGFRIATVGGSSSRPSQYNMKHETLSHAIRQCERRGAKLTLNGHIIVNTRTIVSAYGHSNSQKVDS
jgi:hypothetical protein